jgi:predicted metal-dependent HD superfamily phosphohydrolase
MIRHVVTWKLKAQDAEGKSAAFTEIAQALGTLPALIPTIKSLQVGRDLSESPGNWDIVLIQDYETTADLAAYQVDPKHLAVSAIVATHISERAGVDFEL